MCVDKHKDKQEKYYGTEKYSSIKHYTFYSANMPSPCPYQRIFLHDQLLRRLLQVMHLRTSSPRERLAQHN